MAEENKDVLEFINSLPDSKSNTPKPEGKEEDLLEFLDELAAHDKKPSKLSPKKKDEEKATGDKKEKQGKADSRAKGDATKAIDINTEAEGPTKPQEESTVTQGATEEDDSAGKSANQELQIDPINSITSWWSKEGSSAVSNLWGSITSNATNLSETTYKLASDTTNQLNLQRQEFLKQQEQNGGKNIQQISNITNRLNNILLNITEQINLINTEDELINLIVVNDMVNLSYVNDLIAKNFNNVMDQVEGGIKININNYNYHNHQGVGSDVTEDVFDGKINLNMFSGKLVDGEKLCLANLDNSIKNFNKAIEFESQEQTDLNEKLKLINKSNIFISIQPINVTHKETVEENEILIDQNDSDSFFFLVILNDTTNNIVIKAKTQSFPIVWSEWLMSQNLEKFEEYEDIDPKEWVKGWIRDGLNLTFGVISQQYVIKRMGF